MTEVKGVILSSEDTAHSLRVVVQSGDTQQVIFCHKWQKEAFQNIIGCWMKSVEFVFAVDQEYIKAIRPFHIQSFRHLPNVDRQAGIRRKKWMPR